MLPLEDVARRMVEEFLSDLEKADPTLVALGSARRLVVPGLPGERIAEIAERENACEIVMGTCARTGLSKLLSGSVAKEVAGRSQVPLTVIKDSGADWEANFGTDRADRREWPAQSAGSSPTAGGLNSSPLHG